MARPRQFSDEERLARSRAATAKWRENNREILREKARLYASIPEVSQQLRIYRRALYAAKRQALLEAGYVPNPIGRPPTKRSFEDNILFSHTKPDTNTHDDATTA